MKYKKKDVPQQNTKCKCGGKLFQYERSLYCERCDNIDYVMKYSVKDVAEFLSESNAIEQEYSNQALKDAKKAWGFIEEKSYLTSEIILTTHNLLSKNIMPEIAGQWRDCDVWIGGECKRFISVQLIEDDVRNLCLSLDGAEGEDAKEFAQRSHVRFEHIHPFVDGNGRVGRLIYLWHRMRLGLPIHIIHADWPKEDGEQKNYYKWFK